MIDRLCYALLRLLNRVSPTACSIALHAPTIETPEPQPITPYPTYPHCDSRVLHAPGVCPYCDEYPSWQTARIAQSIGFSGGPVPDGGVPCPADAAVSRGERGDHQAWPGNRPSGYT